MPRRKTTEEVICEFKQAHGNTYDYSLVEYINSGTKVKVICQYHGVFEIAPGHHRNGVRCRKCFYESQTITKAKFLERAKEHFGDRYDYSLFGDLPPHGEKVSIRCTMHDEIFMQEPRSHCKGQTGCSKCIALRLSGKRENRGEIKDHKILTKEFIERAKEVHQDKYDYSEFEYINVATKGKIKCSRHGIFLQTPTIHLNRSGCPQCGKERKRENSLKKLCKEKGVDYWRALKRRDAGMSLDKILQPGFLDETRAVKSIEVNGVQYPSLSKATESLEPLASIRTIRRWLENGMSPEEAFAKIPNPGYSKGVIYLITNAITQKQYVGLTIQVLDRRWQYHIEQANRNHIKSKDSLHAAIREYGKDSFSIEIIDEGTTKYSLEEKERYWIEKLNTIVPKGYNISPGGVSGGSCTKPTMIDDIQFESVRKAAEYLAKSRGISISAAKKRLQVGRLDVPNSKQSLLTKARKAHRRIFSQFLKPDAQGFIPGIGAYEPWRNFETFLKDVGEPPSHNVVFSRLDKSKGYFPENCLWLSKQESLNSLNKKS